MAEIVLMPKMSDTMTEGVVSKWHKKVGDKVKSGDLVAEIETDKATMEFESYQEGVLLYIGVPEGKGAPVNAVLAVLGKEGEDYKPLLEAQLKKQQAAPTVAPAKPVDPAPPRKQEKPVAEKSPEPAAPPASPSHSKASPLAKKMAGEKGIDLSRIHGTGDGGRIVKRDIDWYKAYPLTSVTGNPIQERESHEDIPVSQMRKTIAKRLSESKFTAPHFYLTMEINMGNCMEAREGINTVNSTKISFNDFIIKAVAASLRENPKVNASWNDSFIRQNHHIHIGVAIAVEDGLVVPVVRFADGKTLSQIASEVKALSQKAKDKKLQPSEWEGNTFTISNLGMFGIDEFTAIINSPDSCILAAGAIKETPISSKGLISSAHMMKVTLSCDHRVVDGATGARFLQTLRFLLENPAILLGSSSIA